MKIYSAHGINDFVLLLGYKGEVIRRFFIDYIAQTTDVTVDMSRAGPERLIFHNAQPEPWRVTLLDTGESTMTGARVRRARRYLEGEEDFCLTYGDGVGNIDIVKLIQFHRDHGRIATLTGVFPPSRFGELNVNGNVIAAFNEKPQVSGGYINGGFFVFKPEFIERYLDDGDNVVLEIEPMERLTADQELMMFEHRGFWQPMDTPREYTMLNELWQTAAAPWKVW
jgi:glucose-1-phosphate cytidylyltransferase